MLGLCDHHSGEFYHFFHPTSNEQIHSLLLWTWSLAKQCWNKQFDLSTSLHGLLNHCHKSKFKAQSAFDCRTSDWLEVGAQWIAADRTTIRLLTPLENTLFCLGLACIFWYRSISNLLPIRNACNIHLADQRCISVSCDSWLLFCSFFTADSLLKKCTRLLP